MSGRRQEPLGVSESLVAGRGRLHLSGGHGRRTLGAALLCVSSLCCGNGSRQSFSPPADAGGAGTPSISQPNIDGFWATYANEMDATVVELHADGSQVSGRGCLSGWLDPADEDPYQQCGAITGTIEGNDVSFAFQFNLGPANTYEVDAHLLEGGERMNGEHAWYTKGKAGEPNSNVHVGPATVFRPPPRGPGDHRWPWSPVPEAVQRALQSAMDVTPVGDAPAGKFVPGARYRLQTMWGGLRGEIAVFAPVDLAYQYPDTESIVVQAGPVAQPEPGNAVGLKIEIRDDRVVSIQADLASGTKLAFAP